MKNYELIKLRTSHFIKLISLGMSPIILNVLNLCDEIQTYIMETDSIESRELFTERRLRPITQIKDKELQLQEFRELIIQSNSAALENSL